MSKGEHLGEFEQLVLLALLGLPEEEAYGMNVRRSLAEKAGRDVSVPTVYAALDRLQAKGLVSSEMGPATPQRGGRAKKLFRPEPAAVTQLRDARRRFDSMWDAAGLEPETP